MFPKLASNLLHVNLQRAAVSQTQTAQFRTVLQFSPSYPPSPLPPTPLQPNSILASLNGASSSSGSNGPGAEGSGPNPGSRFYEGYTGPGRAVTQANTITSYENVNTRREEVEDADIPGQAKDANFVVLSCRPPEETDPRFHRRNSLALGFIGPTRFDRAKSFGVLSAVKSQVTQSRHAFCPPKTSPLALHSRPSSDATHDPVTCLSTATGVRQASSLAESAGASAPLINHIPHELRPPDARHAGSTAYASANAPNYEPFPFNSLDIGDLLDQSKTDSPETLAWKKMIGLYSHTANWRALIAEVEKFLDSSLTKAEQYTKRNYTALFRAIGHPSFVYLNDAMDSERCVMAALELYNQMVRRDIRPSPVVFEALIPLLCRRDNLDFGRANRLSTTADVLRILDSDVASARRANEAQALRSGTYFETAVMLFNSATALGYTLTPVTCNWLLKRCVSRTDVATATRLVEHLERHEEALQSAKAGNYASRAKFVQHVLMYTRLIRVHGRARDVKGALKVFRTCRRLVLDSEFTLQTVDIPTESPWHAMMEAYFAVGQPENAVALLEEMLGAKGSSHEGKMPMPSERTYTTIIAGFAEHGQIAEASLWFDRLLEAEKAADYDATPLPKEEGKDLDERDDDETSPATQSLRPIRPTAWAWRNLLTSLWKHGDLPTFSKYYAACEARPHITRTFDYWPQPFFAYYVDLTRKAVEELAPTDPRIDRLLEPLVIAAAAERARKKQNNVIYVFDSLSTVTRLVTRQGRVRLCLRMLEGEPNASSVVPEAGTTPHREVDVAQDLQEGVTIADALGLTQELDLTTLLKVAKLVQRRGLELFPTASVSAPYCAAFGQEVNRRDMKEEDWEVVGSAFAHQLSAGDITMERYQAFISQLHESLPSPSSKVLSAMIKDAAESSLATPVSSPRSTFSSIPSLSSSSSHDFVAVDPAVSRYLSDLDLKKPAGPDLRTFQVCMSFINHGHHPEPLLTARFMTHLAAGGYYAEAKELYTATQPLVHSAAYGLGYQEQAWLIIETAMMTVAARFGDLETANQHRKAIVDRGRAPTADAYAQLILASKSLTDEASIATELFAESQRLGVRPIPFLYNVVISALSKARRAEEALQLFAQMKREGVLPSSVTYGTLIGACARVGDVVSAEQLFREMQHQQSYLPKVPPFNAMIQMYVTAKPDRQKALEYYQMMLHHRLQPTEHTYKLLLDVYSTIGPVDLVSMENVFSRIQRDRRVSVNGTHHASMINAYGCVAKDLEKAITHFESIHGPTRTSPSGTVVLPDVLCYEALFLVFVAHRRPDLVMQYLEKFKASHLHMTPYVANAVIRALAASGDIEGARRMFESMVDPPTGMAVTKTAATTVSDSTSDAGVLDEHELTPHGDTVYREPSTWDTMIRAEIGAGDRGRAEKILARMCGRQYPGLVVQRARDLLHHA